MKTDIQFLTYVVQFFLELEMFQTKFVEETKAHFLFPVTFYWKSYRLWDNVEKYRGAGHATDANMENAHCMLNT